MSKLDLKRHSIERLELIAQLESGQIDKATFIELNVSLYSAYDMTVPESFKSVDEGLFYYQYYNALAKQCQLTYRSLIDVDLFEALEYRNQSSAHYRTKERITEMILNAVEDEHITAYYVQTESRELRNKLVEIVFCDREKVILHSVDKTVVKQLKKLNCLISGIQKSRIDDYINQPYYKT
ncbi:MAG: hypothetical protein CSB19_02315 [Clostridiales bacterium]|nr:MAG: hypothetical protein CSB19_02315 [Clostridiales bacterium]